LPDAMRALELDENFMNVVSVANFANMPWISTKHPFVEDTLLVKLEIFLLLIYNLYYICLL
jgi:hypothetical protein